MSYLSICQIRQIFLIFFLKVFFRIFFGGGDFFLIEIYFFWEIFFRQLTIPRQFLQNDKLTISTKWQFQPIDKLTIATNWQLRQIDKRTNWQVFLLFFLKQFFFENFFLILFFDNVDKLTIFFLTIDNYCQFRQIDKLTISINWHDFFFSFSIFFWD